LGLENLQLFIKSSDNGLQFIDGGVVFLHQYLLLLIRLFLFVRRQLLGILGVAASISSLRQSR